MVGSSIARETDGGIYTHAGPEIGVASTKAFTSQVTVLIMLALMLGRKLGVAKNRGQNLINALSKTSQHAKIILKNQKCNSDVLFPPYCQTHSCWDTNMNVIFILH